eukprot:SAG31_NODE_5089_length_2749_cov_1.514717_2_plen_170_part_00
MRKREERRKQADQQKLQAKLRAKAKIENKEMAQHDKDVHGLVCAQCGCKKMSDHFSKTQWNKREGLGQCKDCVKLNLDSVSQSKTSPKTSPTKTETPQLCVAEVKEPDIFYAASDYTQKGPVTVLGLLDAWRKNDLHTTSLVWWETLDGWVPLDDPQATARFGTTFQAR